MKLIETNAPTTFIPTKNPVLTESAGGQKVLVVEGIFAKADAKNENNRRYPRRVWEKNLAEDSGFRKRLKSRSVLGELEHPESGNTHLERVSHLIVDAWVEEISASKIKEMGLDETLVEPGVYILGKYEVLSTPRGNILRALHEANVRVGISSRGRGDVRSVDGVDEVCDDYEVDTWDAVYLPSVVEANPAPVREATEALKEQQTLGSALPAAGADTDVTPNNTPSDAWKPEAEEIVRALEDAVGGEQDLVDMIPTLQRGINLVDQLAALDDEEAIKLKSQALTLIRVLTNEIMKREAGEKEPGETKPKKAPEGEKKKSKKEEKPKEEGVEEGSMTDLATSVVKVRGTDFPMFRGDVEAELNKAGHDPSEASIIELANELRAQGVEVTPDKYESLTEATKDDVAKLADGAIVSVSAKNLLKRIKEVGPELKSPDTERYEEMAAFLEKQEGEVLARVCSKGLQGYVLRLLEPAYGESNIFVKYGDVKPAKTESKQKEEDMKMKEMMVELVKENDELKKQLGEKGDEESVPKNRYEAAKKLIAGLVEKLKLSEKARLHEEKRVKAATKLIHKLVSEKKATKDDVVEDETEEPTQPVEEAVEEKSEVEAKEEASEVKEAKEEPKEEVAEVKEEVESKEEDPVALAKAITESALANARRKAELEKDDVEESKEEAEEPKEEVAEVKVTEESKDLRKRIRGKKEEEKREAPKQRNLMSAVTERIVR